MADLCIQCKTIVTRRMQAVLCDGSCGRWQHRKCGTGISAAQYKLMKSGELQRDWFCMDCTRQEETEIRAEEPDAELMEVDTDDQVLQGHEFPDQSFDVPGREIQQPQQVLEESLSEPIFGDECDTAVQTSYHEVSNGSIRGGRKLASSDGYTYTVKRQRNSFVYWTCAVRNKKIRCPAWVKQYGGDYVMGPDHVHKADPGAKNKVVINTKAKASARLNIFKPSSTIIEDVVKEEVGPNDHGLPKVVNLNRVINLHRQRLRPQEPKEKDFVVDETFIQADKFMVRDIATGGERHIILATKEQLELLTKAKRWFIDGTFQIVRPPFYQLMSIHAFVRQGESTKLLPLAFCLMSRRTKQDYVDILTALRKSLHDPIVEWFMMDFEAAAWQAVREVFPHSVIKGCCFHWTQAVYRKVQGLGLGPAYIEKNDKYRFIRKVLALPFLPPEHIRPAFSVLEDQANQSDSVLLQQLMAYIRHTWIDGNMWRPETWSVFRETVRTNNDVEGRHRRINTKAGRSELTFYVLVPLLLAEAETVDLQIRLVSENLLTRDQRKHYKRSHCRLIDLWDQYEEEELTTTQLLREASHIMGFGPVTPAVESS